MSGLVPMPTPRPSILARVAHAFGTLPLVRGAVATLGNNVGWSIVRGAQPTEYKATPCGHIQPGKVTLGSRP